MQHSHHHPLPALIPPVNPELALLQNIPLEHRPILAHAQPVDAARTAYPDAAFDIAVEAELGF